MANEGINSQEQRDQINYHPYLEYTRAQIQASDYIAPNATESATLNNSSMKDTWSGIIDTINELNKLDQTLSLKLKGVSASIPQNQLAAVQGAASAIGLDVKGSISFEQYKAALALPESLERNVILDTFENYHHDVNGQLNAELYADVVQLKEDWNQIAEFTKRGLFAQLIPTSDLPSTLLVDDPNVKKVDAAEKALIDAFVKSKQLRDGTLSSLRASYLMDTQSDTYSQLSRLFKDVDQSYKALERRVNTRAEVQSLIDSKAIDSGVTITYLGNCIDFNPYTGDVHDVLYNLLKQYPTRQALENGLRKIQALMKLSIDGKIDSLLSLKSNQGLSNNTRKAKMNNTLVNSIHLRNEVYGDVHDFMNRIDGLPQESPFHTVADHIVDSIQYADQSYSLQSSDFYKIHALDNELRRDKLKSLVDKDSAREIYKLIDRLVTFATNRNSWPDSSNLSAWLTDFMQSEKLS